MSNSKKKGYRKRGENKNELIILVDSNSVAHMVKHTMKGLKGAEREAAIIFGFMRQILSMANNFNTNRFVFAWDSRKRLRSRIYREYKKRDKELTKEDVEAFEQFAEIRAYVLPKFGFENVFIQTGYEADDIVAKVVDSYWNKKIAIISRDSDLYQVLNDNNFMWHPTKKKRYSKDDFVQDYKMAPFQWADVKALAGDTSDTIEGIHGIGISRACQIVRGELNDDSTIWHKVRTEDSQKIIERNKSLVTLPFPGTKQRIISMNEQFHRATFLSICKEYSFKSFLTTGQIRSWTERFEMK